GVPRTVFGVLGDQAFGTAMSGENVGSVMLTVKASRLQPRPNGPHSSRCTFSNPHFVRRPLVHSAAVLSWGVLVRRGPRSSVRKLMVSMTWDFFRPSSLILLTTSVSTFSAGSRGR